MFSTECDDLYTKQLADDWLAAVGGVDARIGEFPYMAALGWNDGKSVNDFLCGGVLIDKNYILTAAHCISMAG